jgi:tetratricopeptide (TPR) repeat protein
MDRLKSFATPNSTFFSLIVIAVVCLLSYSNTFHVPFQFDDSFNISEKPFVRDISVFFDSVKMRRFSPDSAFSMRIVGYFTFAVNYLIHGDDVAGYHVVNIAIHLISAILVYFLVLLTFRTPYFSGQRSAVSSQPAYIALFTALLFVSHPVQTQAVTYIVQRLASLATLFYLLSLVMYIRWRLLLEQKRGSGFFWASALLSAVLAMKTKEISFTLPLVIALYEFLFFHAAVKRRTLYLLPFLLTMLIIPLSLIGAAKPAGKIIGDVSEAMRVGSSLSRWDYLFTECRVIVTYIRLLFFPVNQNLDYDYPVYHSFFDPNVFLSFLFLFSIFCGAVYLLFKSRHKAVGYRLLEKGSYPLPLNPYFRLIAFGIFWFFITLSVESSIIPITDVIFEHRLYLPSAGFFIAAASGISIALERFRDSLGKIVIAALGILIVLFSGLTYLRNNVWRSEVSLWEDVAGKSPMKARAYNGLGLAYQKEGRLDKALESFARAIAINPSYAVAYNSLGTAYFRKNFFGRAAEEFSKAIALEQGNAVFYNNRGLAYAAMGEIDRAAADYEEAIKLDPLYAEAYHNLGSVFHGKGLYDRAISEYSRAISIEPDIPIYYNNRALSFSAIRDFNSAVADYTKAIALKPDFADAFTGRGIAFGEMGRLDEAVSEFSRAISLDPANASAYFNRAVVYERMQNIGTALSDFQKACEIGDERGCNGVEYIKKKYQAGE